METTREKKQRPKHNPMAGLRIPPQNLDAEKALLGALLIRGNAMIEIVDQIVPEAFYLDKHRIIYRIMLELFTERSPLDLITVSGKLTEQKSLESAGGLLYLTELTTSVPSSTNVEYYAKIVAAKHTLRDLIEAGHTITELGYFEEESVESSIDQAEKTLFAVTQTSRGKAFTNIKDLLPATWDQIERLHESTGDLRGVPTGYKGIDNKLAGLQPADLIILAARPSMGKTSFALDIARRAALYHNVPVGLFSLEMSAQQLVDRMLASDSRVDLWRLRTGKGLTEEDLDAIRDGMARLATAPLYIDDEPSMSILKMRSSARRLKMQHGLGLIIVDYLQLITPPKSYDSLVTQVSEISRSLKGLARELNVPILALSQLSRAVEARGGRPRLSDLRDSGAIEQDADVVMFIHREKEEDQAGRSNNAEILIEKHRNGPTGKVDLYFDAEKATFLDIEQNDFSGFESGSPAIPTPLQEPSPF